MKRKYIGLTSILLIVLLVFTACGADTWDEHYELGMKYLTDGNYEEAIIEFTAAIEIDEMKPEAYIGAADGYVGMEEYQKAIDILTSGYEKCNDEEIYKKLLQLRFEYDSENLNETFYEWGIDNLMTLDEFTLNDKPIYTMSWNKALKNVQSIYAARGSKYTADGHGGFEIENGPKDMEIYVSKSDYSGGIDVEYRRSNDETYLGWRNIELGEGLESVLIKLGFSQDGIEYLTYLIKEEVWKDIPIPYDPDEEGGGCVGLLFDGNGSESFQLDLIYVGDYSDSKGHDIIFMFNNGILGEVFFHQNITTLE